MKKILSILGAFIIAMTGIAFAYGQYMPPSYLDFIDSSPNYLQTSYDPENPTVRLPLGSTTDRIPSIYVDIFDALTATIGLVTSGDLTIEDITPSIFFKDTDALDGDNNASIDINCTDCTSANEDIDMSFKVQEGGALIEKILIDADSGVIVDDSLKMINANTFWMEDGRTAGIAAVGTPNTRFGIIYTPDEGASLVLGNSDNNGNHCLNIISGTHYLKDYDCDILLASPTVRIFSATDPDVDNQEFAQFYHDGFNFKLESLTGNINLDPIAGEVVVDGAVVESVSSTTQVLNAGNTLTISAKTNRVASSGGAVTITSTPTLPTGSFDGECRTIEGTSDTNVPTLQDDDNLAGTTLELEGNLDASLGLLDRLTVCWNSSEGKWAEDSRKNN